MKDKESLLNELYNQCIEELKLVNIDFNSLGIIDIAIAKRKCKRYGCCKQEEPDKQSKVVKKIGYRRIVKYEKFNKHHIEISAWVLELEENIIKNTIMHELIHCLPYCNNHGEEFKKYAKVINEKLGYDISRFGNKKEDYEKSNLEFKEKVVYKYKIECKKCGQIFYRQRYNKNLIKRYRCGKCRRKAGFVYLLEKEKFKMWLIFAIITVLLWGTSETIFKSVSNEEENSVLKLISYNGIILGICAFLFMIVTKTEINLKVILTYLPVSIIFITSMFFAYKAMKLVKISIISPVQNSSCALTCILCVFLLKQELTIVQVFAVIAIIVGIILLSINKSETEEKNDKCTYKNYILGIAFALGYWLLDGVGSFFDDYTLDETLSAEQLIIAFSFIYCIVGVISYIILKIKNTNNKIEIKEGSNKILNKKLIGTLIETAGQYTYIYTFAFGEAALASPFIAAYSIVSLILSRIFLKEKLNRKQYFFIAVILIGMIVLSIE